MIKSLHVRLIFSMEQQLTVEKQEDYVVLEVQMSSLFIKRYLVWLD